MRHEYPKPGDLIQVERSEWYAVQDGEFLRVCEEPGWAISGRDIYVAPRAHVRTFWGPNQGAPDGNKREHLSTSGGPFKTVTLVLIPIPIFVERRLDDFWHWRDWPRAGGGVEYQREVALWRLSLLPDDTWIDPALERRVNSCVHPPGPIRLACAECDRDDMDGIHRLPPDWTNITFVQSLAASRKVAPASDANGQSPFEWYTHLGLCPACQRVLEAHDAKRGES